MKILRNYVLKEFLGPLILAVVALIFIMLLGSMIKIVDLIINKGVDIFTVSKLLLYLIPFLITYTLPIACLTAVLLSLGRLSHDNEIMAIKASGVNLWRLIAPLLIIGTILSMGLFIFNDRVIPYANFATRKTMIDIGIKNPAAALEPGVFINSFDKYVLFIYGIEGNKLSQIRIYQPEEGKPTRTILAKRGEFISLPEEKIVKLKLMDGTSDEPDPKNPNNFYKLSFKNYFMTLNIAKMQAKGNIEKKPKDMNLEELRQAIGRYETQKIDTGPLRTEMHKRISLAFSCIVLTLLGAPLAMITHRREKSVNFGMAFVVTGLYFLLLVAAEGLSIQNVMPAAIAMWIPNVLLGGIGFILTLRLCAY